MLKQFRLSREIVMVYAAQIVQVLVSFASSILLARWLGKEGQGEITLYTNALSGLILVVSLGVPSAVVYFLSSGRLRKSQCLSVLAATLGTALLLMLLFGFIPSTVLSTIYPSFFASNKHWPLLLCVHVLILLIQQMSVSFLQSEKKFTKQAIVQIAGNLLYLGVILWLFTTKRTPSFSPVIVAMISNLLFQVIILFVFLSKQHESFWTIERIDSKLYGSFFSFGLLAFLTNLIQFFNYKMDVWFMNFYFQNKGMIGEYAIAVSLAQMIWLLPQAMQTVLYQHVSAAEQNAQKRAAVGHQIKLILSYVLCLCIPAILLSPWFITTLYGDSFSASINLFQYLLLAVLPFSLTMPVSAYFAGTGRVHINLYSAILGFMVCIISNLVFIPAYQSMGAVLSSIFSYGTTTLYLVWMYWRDGISSRS